MLGVYPQTESNSPLESAELQEYKEGTNKIRIGPKALIQASQAAMKICTLLIQAIKSAFLPRVRKWGRVQKARAFTTQCLTKFRASAETDEQVEVGEN